MPHDLEPIHAERGVIARELFVHTADDNYIAARGCFVEGLNVDWFWLAVHALEKYMKAALLLNGHSASRHRDADGKRQPFGHDIVTLFARIRSFADDPLRGNLTRPDALDIAYWRDETPGDRISRRHRAPAQVHTSLRPAVPRPDTRLAGTRTP